MWNSLPHYLRDADVDKKLSNNNHRRCCLQRSLLVCVFRISRSSSYIKVIGSRSRSQDQQICSVLMYTAHYRFSVKTYFIIQQTTAAAHKNSNTVYRTIVLRRNFVKNLHVNKKQTFSINDLLQSPTFEKRSQHLRRYTHTTHTVQCNGKATRSSYYTHSTM